MKNPFFPLNIAFAVCLSVSAAAQTPEPFLLKPLPNGAFAAIDNAAAKAEQAGSNAGFVVGADAVLVVDTFENPKAAEAMLSTIQQKTKLPVKFVVNTHYHLDHVAGNGVMAAAGARVFAHQNVRGWERTENLKFFGDKITAQQRSFVEGLYLPDVTYAQEVTLYLGPNQPVVLRYMPGHTGGDTVVYDAASNVVFCGDLFWNHTLPNLIDASTKPWIETLDTLIRDYPTASFVPGHGDNVGSAEDVRAFRNYLAFVREAVAKAQSGGASREAVAKVVLPQLQAKFGTWAFFDFATPDIERTDEELRGTKRLPPLPAKP